MATNAHEPNLSETILDICRPYGPIARLTVLLAAIENGRLLLIRASDHGYTPERIAGLCMEEFAKVAQEAELYRKAAGLPEPFERRRGQ